MWKKMCRTWIRYWIYQILFSRYHKCRHVPIPSFIGIECRVFGSWMVWPINYILHKLAIVCFFFSRIHIWSMWCDWWRVAGLVSGWLVGIIIITEYIFHQIIYFLLFWLHQYLTIAINMIAYLMAYCVIVGGGCAHAQPTRCTTPNIVDKPSRTPLLNFVDTTADYQIEKNGKIIIIICGMPTRWLALRNDRENR